MDEGKYLYLSLILIFVIGGIVPLVISNFVNVEVNSYDGYLSPIVTFVQEGVTIKLPLLSSFTLNFFKIFGGTIQNFIASQIVAFGLIPEIIGIPLLILIVFGFVYGIVRLIRG